MTKETYTNRRIQNHVVKRKEHGAVISTDGTGSGAPQEVLDILEVGDEYGLEVRGFNRISGYLIKGVWYAHKSDQELDREDQEMIDRARQRHLEYVKKSRVDWTEREAALPEWAREGMDAARVHSESVGEDFDTAYLGWGYKLTSMELAVLYTKYPELLKKTWLQTSREELPADIVEFSDKYGTSGSQDEWARMVARAYLDGVIGG